MVRGWGDCYGYLLVATGRAEVMVAPVLSAAGDPRRGSVMTRRLDRARAIAECADLVYHSLVALRVLGAEWSDVAVELRLRRAPDPRARRNAMLPAADES